MLKRESHANPVGQAKHQAKHVLRPDSLRLKSVITE